MGSEGGVTKLCVNESKVTFPFLLSDLRMELNAPSLLLKGGPQDTNQSLGSQMSFKLKKSCVS